MASHAAIYARISSDHEGDHLGVKRQVEECHKLAARLGYNVADEYVDNDISAHSGKRRPEYVRLLGDLCDGSVDGIVTFAMDRLHRNPLEQEEFFVICKNAGVTVLQTIGGPVDIGSYMGKGMARFSGLMAAMESDIKSSRSLAKHAQLAADGKVSGGGARPFGFTDDKRHVVPEEAAAIREAVSRFLAGDSIRSICRDFNARGITSASGGTWTTSVMSKMLRSGRISGQRDHHGEIAGPAEWPAIVTPQQTAGVRAALDAQRRAAAPTPRRYVLVGLLRCALCNTPMVSRPRTGGVRQYVCASDPPPGCGKMSVLAEPVELLISEFVMARLDTPEFLVVVEKGIQANNQAVALREQLDAEQAVAEEYNEMFANRQITRDLFLSGLGTVQPKIDALKKKIARITANGTLEEWIGNGEKLAEQWPGMDLARQKAIIAGVLDHAVVSSAVRGRNKFDENRIKPVWKT